MARKPRRPDEWESYYGEIVDWNVDYSLRVGRLDRYPQPYNEYLALEVALRLHKPDRLVGQDIEMTILGRREADRELNAEQHGEFLPLVVGTLTVRGERRSYLGSLPYTAIMGLLPALESRRIRMVVLHGKRLYRGEAQITSMSLVREVDPDEWG